MSQTDSARSFASVSMYRRPFSQFMMDLTEVEEEARAHKLFSEALQSVEAPENLAILIRSMFRFQAFAWEEHMAGILPSLATHLPRMEKKVREEVLSGLFKQFGSLASRVAVCDEKTFLVLATQYFSDPKDQSRAHARIANLG